MFRYFNNNLSKLAATLVGCLLLSTAVNAATIWAVDKGADAGTRLPGVPLTVTPGNLKSVDIYLNAPTVYGFQLFFDVFGVGQISNVVLDPTGSPGTTRPNGGWGQTQSYPEANGRAGPVLALSFDFLGEAGAFVAFTGDSSFTNLNFDEESLGSIAEKTLLTTVIPIPGAVWLLGSGLVALVGFGRRKAAGVA